MKKDMILEHVCHNGCEGITVRLALLKEMEKATLLFKDAWMGDDLDLEQTWYGTCEQKSNDYFVARFIDSNIEKEPDFPVELFILDKSHIIDESYHLLGLCLLGKDMLTTLKPSSKLFVL